MSFYSALVLVANEGVRPPDPKRVERLFADLGLINPNPRYNLTDDITALFNDPAAMAENRRFFAPDSISFDDGIEVEGPDCYYSGPGWAVTIHGNGYLFPWEISDVRSRILPSEKLRALQAEFNRLFGGWFRFPPNVPELRERLIDGEGGWTWFMSESM